LKRPWWFAAGKYAFEMLVEFTASMTLLSFVPILLSFVPLLLLFVAILLSSITTLLLSTMASNRHVPVVRTWAWSRRKIV
jgi:hypothetical protein